MSKCLDINLAHEAPLAYASQLVADAAAGRDDEDAAYAAQLAEYNGEQSISLHREGRTDYIPMIEEDDDPPLDLFNALLRTTKKPNKRKRKNRPYEDMLQIVLQELKDKGKVNTQIGPLRLPPPQLGRDGSKKVVWINFKETCNIIERSEEHFRLFIVTELGTSGQLDGNNQLILKGRFTTAHIEKIIRKYLDLYSKCLMCRSYNTNIEKDTSSRFNILTCNQCKATRTIQGIEKGYSAQIGKRK